MGAFLWRVIVVVIAVVLLQLIVPLLLEVLGVSPSAAAMQLIRICLIGIAIFYLLTGPWPSSWPWTKT